ncbi:MAG: hypothetical protein K0B06_04275 [Brevefilum sp.]|nr:hypothetical protein [Brevefilum sp.]
MYDLKLIPIVQAHGKPIPNGSGFLAASPPRRAARSRSEDMLILSFTTSNSERITPELQNAWLANLVQIFFKTSGSVTSALRVLIDTLNLTMMERNLKSAKGGAAATGAINLAAVHRRSVYVVQCGLTHAFTLTPLGLQHFFDASQTDRGLGVSRTPTVRYYQADLGSGGYLFMSDSPSKTWNEDQLNFGGFPNLEQLRRRLLNQASPNLRLDLVQIVPGEGQVVTLKPAIPAADAAEPTPSVTFEEAQPIPARDVFEPESPVVDEVGDTQKMSQPPETVEIDETAGAEIPLPSETAPSLPEESEAQPGTDQVLVESLGDETEDQSEEASEDELEEEPIGEPESEHQDEPEVDLLDEVLNAPKKRKEKKTKQPARSFNENVELVREGTLRSLAEFFDWRRKASADVGHFFKTFFSRVGLTDEEGVTTLSNQTMLAIALAIPLVVVVMAVGIYLSRGRTLQYQYYLEQAEMASISAYAAEDPSLARASWSQAMMYLDQAESFRRTDEVTQMRSDTQRALDLLDGAVRLAYHPAIAGSLHDGINITRIISYGLDLYLLDAAGGRVIHATRGGQGYQVDPEFVCSAGNFSGGAVDTLIDMVSLPINNPYQAHVLAADAIGNVIYCGPGQSPVVQTLPRGEGGVDAVTRIAGEGNLLYVLDPSADAVRVYRSTNGQFLDEPTNFFTGADDGQKPPLGRIVDIAVNGSELYLLRDDGLLVSCVVTGLQGNPVNCENPVTYVDGRPGKEDQPVVMPDSPFIAVQYTLPPEPAVNILEGESADIFRFSLRFRLHQRLRSDFGNYEILSPTATAFTIGVDRIAFVAYGHQVFYAYVE